jgi:hypothetical protein
MQRYSVQLEYTVHASNVTCCDVHRSLETLRRPNKIVKHSGRIRAVGICMTLQNPTVKPRPSALILMPCLFKVVGTTPAVRVGDESPVWMRELISADRYSRPLGTRFLSLQPTYFDESYLTNCGVFSEQCSLQMQPTSSVRLSYCQCKLCHTFSNGDAMTPDVTTSLLYQRDVLVMSCIDMISNKTALRLSTYKQGTNGYRHLRLKLHEQKRPWRDAKQPSLH